MADTRPMIELAHLSRHFGSTRAADDISFQVHAGEVFGYIGPNGAGKTTSMRILATLDLPTHGDAFIDGFSVVNDPTACASLLMPTRCAIPMSTSASISISSPGPTNSAAPIAAESSTV